MKATYFKFLILLSTITLISWKGPDNGWMAEKYKGYNLKYTSADKANITEYNKLIKNGMSAVRSFFHDKYNKAFEVFVHPNRHSLDSSWQKDWKMPSFKSECWMVASGVANRLDMISPKRWDDQSCEHIFSETTHTQQLITHELVHVYHGQLNISPDFGNTEGIDWFVEGLATYASGQCDSLRIAEIKKAISENKIPNNLDNFWTGKLKYGLSGSLVMYIDKKYGRVQLKKLLPFNKRSEILSALHVTETELLTGWKNYISSL